MESLCWDTYQIRFTGVHQGRGRGASKVYRLLKLTHNRLRPARLKESKKKRHLPVLSVLQRGTRVPRDPHAYDTHPNISWQKSFLDRSGTFQPTALLSLRLSIIVCMLPKTGGFISYCPSALLELHPTDFQIFQSEALLICKSRLYGGLSPLVQIPRAGRCLKCVLNSLLFKKNLHACSTIPTCKSLSQGFGS